MWYVIVSEALRDKILARTSRVGVIGLGYVGLPLAVEFAKAGLKTTAFDIDRQKVDQINRGESYIGDVAAGDVRAVTAAGFLHATVDFSELASVDTVDICVPTPLRKTGDPDLSYVVSVVDEIAKYIRAGQLIILESTTYPGTVEEVVRPKLEADGLRAGADFYLAFSPERVDPGNPEWNTRNIPKVVGGVNDASTDMAVALYEQVVGSVVPVSSTTVAEMVKLLENTFRAVNIGLANELALMCQRLGVNVWEVIDAAKTKPFGFMPFYPGPGLGGALHSDRPPLPELEGQAERFREPIHRARRAHQCRDAPLCRRADCRGAQQSVARDQRFESAPVRPGVQAQRQRHTGVAGDRHRGLPTRARGRTQLQ